MEFEDGDIFLSATLLDNPKDDHAGKGRIFQFSRSLSFKSVIHTPDTSHLVKGLMFGPDGVLWAFDTSEHLVLQIGPDGYRRANPILPERPWSSGFFDNELNLFLYEHLVGSINDVPEKYKNMQRIIPECDDKIGDGNVYKFSPQGELISVFQTETSTSFAGFLGVTSCSLHPGQEYITYTTETSKRIMRFDICKNSQMNDLLALPNNLPEYVFCLDYCSDGNLLITRSSKIQLVGEFGHILKEYPLEGRGWATVKESNDKMHIFVTSFFHGFLLKIEKETGKIVGSINLESQRSLAGVAEFAQADL